MKEHDGIKYISGGAGSSEADALNRMDDQYNLKLTMSVSSGQFTVPSRLRIEDRGGAEILEIVPNGPILLAKLEPGEYVIHVRRRGQQGDTDCDRPCLRAGSGGADLAGWRSAQPRRRRPGTTTRAHPVESAEPVLRAVVRCPFSVSRTATDNGQRANDQLDSQHRALPLGRA